MPRFADRAAWVELMKTSIARLAPLFSMQRAVIEYAERYYLPASRARAGSSRSSAPRPTASARLRRPPSGAEPLDQLLDVLQLALEMLAVATEAARPTAPGSGSRGGRGGDGVLHTCTLTSSRSLSIIVIR